MTFWLSWFNMLHSLNEIPWMSIFLPVTSTFLKSFGRFCVYMLLILSAYTYIFHQLMEHVGGTGFQTWPISFMKTVVWFVGDLGYDDSFLSDEEPLLYPFMTNFVFLVFITSITGLVAHLIVTQPTDHLDKFKDDAEFNHIASRLHLIFRYDRVLHDGFARRKAKCYVVQSKREAFIPVDLWKRIKNWFLTFGNSHTLPAERGRTISLIPNSNDIAVSVV